MGTFLWLNLGLLWILMLLNLVLTLALIRRTNASAKPVQPEPLPSGMPAPAFRAESLEGETVSRATFRARGLFLVFVSPQCQPCRALIPRIQDLWARTAEPGLEIVLVSLAGPRENRGMRDELEIVLPLLCAPEPENDFARNYRVARTPSYCFVEGDEVRAAGMLSPDLSALHEALGPRVAASARD